MIPNATKVRYFDGQLDMTVDTLRVALGNDSIAYTPDPDTHQYVADVFDGVTAAEFGDTNYSRQTLTTPTTTQDNVDDEAEFDADDVTWTALGGTETVQFIMIYKQVGADDTTPADDPIIRIIDDSETAELPKATNGDDFSITWSSEGILNLG